jgi:putative SOS response-associated peptidase YedK
MCGRYVSPAEAELNREYRIDAHNLHIGIADALERSYEQSFNVAPTDLVPVVRVIRNKDGERESVLMRWGLIPYFANGDPPRYSTINATIEKLETAPAWRGPWSRGQRCIVPCAGFYEWQVQPDGRTKQPFYIKPANGEIFSFAGLWDVSYTPTGERVVSCAVITMPANALMRDIHNAKQRMPAILQREDIETWLSGTQEAARAVLKEFPSDEMLAWPVSNRVNSTKNAGPDLIQRIPFQRLDLFG